jgi:hypothetical protein
VVLLPGAEDGGMAAPGDLDRQRFIMREPAPLPNAGHFLFLEGLVLIAARRRAVGVASLRWPPATAKALRC